ncbi:hypothetical protein CO659_12570 [Rhizobium sp. S9]|uniref:hypothetical protein n=1 Tax=Rhizobium sp. S9 TaxID=2035454 RepID=UPI000BEAC43B|nr:hypothetical protein [Rhizobium sp. S9]PDS97495.1 hypothetical protein CO659_12570 [Rhizobium sp. S9]
MKVEGFLVTQDLIDAACAIVVDMGGGFTAIDMEKALEKSGMPSDKSFRGADRILQKLRKGGHITFNGGRWHFI